MMPKLVLLHQLNLQALLILKHLVLSAYLVEIERFAGLFEKFVHRSFLEKQCAAHRWCNMAGFLARATFVNFIHAHGHTGLILGLMLEGRGSHVEKSAAPEKGLIADLVKSPIILDHDLILLAQV